MLWGLCIVPMCVTAADAPKAPSASNAPGKKVFERFCAECHAPGHGHPGTQRLGWSKGEASAILENRKDLTADYVKAIVRSGALGALRVPAVTDSLRWLFSDREGGVMRADGAGHER